MSKRDRRRNRRPLAQKASGSPIRATMARPFSPAAISVASMVLTTSALAQSSGETLPTIDVQGEGGGGYQVTNSSIGRLPVPLIDTPQTVNVVPQQIIQEQRATTMEDALRAVPGITFGAGEGAQQGDLPIIRGFVARGDLFRDGIRDPGWYTRDLFNADRVEVYKGPSAFAFGRGATGGAVNTVTRLPTGATFIEADGSGTTGPGARGTLDASGKTGNVAARIAALYQDVDTPTRDNVWTRRWGVAPSFAVAVTDNTRVIASYIYQGEQGAPDYGFTFLPQPAYSAVTGALTNPGYYGNGAPTPPLPVPRTNWYGVPTGDLRDITETETNIGTVKIEHEFDNGVKLANATRYIDNDRFSRPTALRSPGDSSNRVFGTPGAASQVLYPIDLMTVG